MKLNELIRAFRFNESVNTIVIKNMRFQDCTAMINDKKYKYLYNLEPLMIATICNNSSTYNATASGSRMIKRGEFKVTNHKSEEMCKAFSDLFIKIGTADRWVKHQFLKVFIQAYGHKNYNHSQILKNIQTNISQIKAMTDVTAANQFIQKQVFNII